MERGLNSVGLHVCDGSLLWDTLREFELAHLSLAEAGSEEFATQLLRVVEIYRRQLSVPLLDMEKTYKEWEDFIQQLPDDHGIDVKQIEWGYKKAQQLLESYKPYEESLTFAKNEDEMFKVYSDYINFVKDPSLKMVLYERAVCELCLNAVLWENYCYYTLELGEIASKVSERALRNCPWHVTLWVTRLRTLEVLQKPKEDLTACFEEAVKSVPVTDVLDLWFAYIEYIKRNADDMELLDKLLLQAKEQLEPHQKSKILRFQARIHAKNGDITGARKIWSEIMSHAINKSSAYAWIEYLEIEKRFGDSKCVRQVYQRAISNCRDWQHYFADEWVMYEREIGTIDDILKCVQKCKEKVKYIREDTLTQSKDSKRKFDEEDGKYNQPKRHKVGGVHPKYNSESKQKDVSMKESRRPPAKVRNPPTDIDTEKTVFLSNFVPKVTETEFKKLFPNAKDIIIPTDRKGIPKNFAYVLFETADEAAETLKRDRLPIDGRPLFISKCQKDRTQRQPVFKYSGKFEGNKLFVKGLPKHYNKERVEEIFKPYKAIDVRLVTRFNGEPRGFAYVDFATVEDANLAMKNTDQMILGEHTISVAMSAPPNKRKEPLPVSQPPTVRNSKSKLEIPFIPRSVKVKQTEPKEVPNISKTNDDFRKMLLDK